MSLWRKKTPLTSFSKILKIESVDAVEKAPMRSSGDPPEPDQEALQAEVALLLFSLQDTESDHEKVAAGCSGTQEQDDVFHTPPEKSSYQSSGDMPPSEPCQLNQEVYVLDDETLWFVDLDDSQGNGCVNLGRDSELGDLEVKPSQEFEGFEKETCISGLPMKKLKLSVPNLGLESSRACLGVESQELKEGNGNCSVGADVEPEKVDLAEELVSMDIEVPVQNNLGSCHGNEANELGCGNEGQKKNKNFVFDVLSFLAENSAHENEDAENDGENASSADFPKIRGVDSPRPVWWQDTDSFEKGKKL